jgi:hypothetical protein
MLWVTVGTVVHATTLTMARATQVAARFTSSFEPVKDKAVDSIIGVFVTTRGSRGRQAFSEALLRAIAPLVFSSCGRMNR